MASHLTTVCAHQKSPPLPRTSAPNGKTESYWKLGAINFHYKSSIWHGLHCLLASNVWKRSVSIVRNFVGNIVAFTVWGVRGVGRVPYCSLLREASVPCMKHAVLPSLGQAAALPVPYRQLPPSQAWQ
eukprot:2392039-Amphidinium_carterae.1